MDDAVPPQGATGWPGLATGGLAATAALSVSVLFDGMFDGVPSLVHGVGQAIIRAAPGIVARQGVEAAGTADKPLLITGTVVLAIVLGALAGTSRRRWLLPSAFALAAALGAVATAWATTAGTGGTLIGAVGAGATGIAVASWLGRRAQRPTPVTGPPRPIGSATSRRQFLTTAGVVALGSGAATAVGRKLVQTSALEAARAAVLLPTPTGSAAEALPLGTELGIAGLSPVVTPNDDFYRIDEALLVPAVDLDGWRLEVEGMVDHPLSLTYDELLAEDLVEHHVTLACVSNEVGGGLISNARWLGVRLVELLDRAGVQTGADQLVGRSVDGFTVGFPTAVALDGRDALVAVGMNGEPLPRKHGFPARLVVPGLYGYVSATKWLRTIELTTWDAFDAYWVQRGWAKEAPIKTQSRIDVPRSGSRAAAGAVAVAGVAWAQHRGIERVEVRVDGGDWQEATLAAPISADTWRQWHLAWDATPGDHVLEVRATDATGEPQDEERRPVFPDGATGYHCVSISVE